MAVVVVVLLVVMLVGYSFYFDLNTEFLIFSRFLHSKAEALRFS